MEWIEPYTYYLSMFGLFLFFVGIILLKKPRTLSRILLSVTMLFIGIFVLLTALELLIDDYHTMLWLRNLQQVTIFLSPVTLFGYAQELYKQNNPKTLKYLCLLAVPSIISLLLIFTNQWHGWMRSSIQLVETWNLTEISVTPTGLGMLLYAYPNFLNIFTVVLLMRNMNDLPSSFRISHILSAIAIVTPLTFIMFFSIIPVSIPGEVALSFSIMAILLIMVNKRYDYNSIWPISRGKILESLDEGILLFDFHCRLIEINPSGRNILHHTFGWEASNDQLLGKNVKELFQYNEIIILPVQERKNISFEWKYRSSCFQLNIVPIGKNEQNEMLLLVITDLTEKKAIENKLYHLAHHDDLTNISNRRSFIESFNNRVKDNNDYTFLLLDVDYFKQFNDNYGHIIGDKVLKRLANLLDEYFICKSEYAIVGRIGGEEFAVLIDKKQDEAMKIAKEFQKLLAEVPILIEKEKKETITVSIGMSTNDKEKDFTFEKAYYEADQALYRAKRSGRDHVEVYAG
ncbi:histidine kinase N-terminal 7TM domain-containing diguanylate cyclase [Gracilibacillus oryzae]|uniref:histidine kinase N-terminal 7TM domain-containing diguanylate cyclase n=1 Tax=Gracilibacillus oryzae TaxID=1672701 RepID=UPI001D17D5C6|nr:diguanylate cyclase [Gracilibacillus oryzae]